MQHCDSGNNTHTVTTVLVTSLVSVFVVLLVIVFIIGLFCGHCLGRKSSKSSKSESPKTEAPLPLYEDVHVHVLPSTMHPQEEHGLELSENVAYGSSR